jgi:hypothetical protein
MTTTETSVDTICQCRKGSMDDKQFRATVEYNIQSLLTAERQKREEIVLKGERRRIIEQIRDERDTYWKERVREEVEGQYWDADDYAPNQRDTVQDHNIALDTLLDKLK